MSETKGSDPALDGSFEPMLKDAVMPIAIVGIAGRFPGDAENPMKLWDMIAAGRSALSDIPPDRFNVDAYYHPHNERQGTINVRKAHFMKRDITAFDAPFFTMPIPEAIAMDPQQRMALECTYEALENAGIPMENVSGSNTSCFVGCFTRDYSDMLACDPEDLPLYHGTGTGSAIMSNRISWFFNMKGTSVSLDTACSSSMVALHLGCQSLRTGETTMSVVGGTNLMLMPDIMGAMTRLHFLSPDGKCQSFDHKANGYSRGEGAGFCVLKPLHLALKDGDVIRGVIRNSGVSQDGNTPGITVPSAEAQEGLIRRVYAEAALSLDETTYVEAHGTGTPAGDPVEAGALGATFGRAKKGGNQPLYIGSIKSNVGHLEGGSGLVQVIKTVMMLEKGEIPPSLYFEKPNPRIPMDEWNLSVPTKLMPWPNEGLRRISINSFGYGGTNAHCIIDDAYHYLKARQLTGHHNVQGVDVSQTTTPDSGIGSLASNKDGEPLSWPSQGRYLDEAGQLATSPKLLVWTSHEQAGIDTNAKIYGEYLAEKLAGDLSDDENKVLLTKFARTLASHRSILPWKSFVVSGSTKQAVADLESPTKPIRTSTSKTIPGVAFVFTGQGAQWFAMGRELFANSVFRESVEAAGRYFTSIGAPWSLVEELYQGEDASRLDQADLSQAACTALQVALVDQLRVWGIRPVAVVGHSSGEISAAYAKGALKREDAWKIAYHRGRLSSSIKDCAPQLKGAMLATGISAAAAAPYIERISKGSAAVACINSPASTTLSGDAEAIEELERLIKADGHFARKLRVGVAYHSTHMQVIADQYKEALGDIQPIVDGEESVKMFSSLTGERVTNSDLGSSYWVGNLVSPVRFSQAVEGLVKHSDTKRRTKKKAYVQHLIEIGPHAALQGPIKQILSGEELAELSGDVIYQSVLERGKDAYKTALTTAGRLFQYGYPVSVSAVNNDGDGPEKDGSFLVDVPPFGWNHSLKYWSETNHGRGHRFRKHPRKDLFGGETLDALLDRPRFRNILRLNEVPWTQDHKVQGSVLYPAAGMMIMAIEAMRQKADATRPIKAYELRDIIISRAIVLPQGNDSGVETMLTLHPFRHGSQALGAAWQEFHLLSRKDDWELNCSGLIRIEYENQNQPNSVFADEESLESERYADEHRQIRDECSRGLHPNQFYDQLESIGLYYGGVFQGLSEIRKGEYCSSCRIKIPDTKAVMPRQFEFSHVIHPATLDSIIQMALPASYGIDQDLSGPIVPVAINRLYISADVPSEPGTILSGYAASRIEGLEERKTSVVVSSEEWTKPLVIFEGIQGKKVGAAVGSDQIGILRSKIGTYFQWQPDLSMLDRQQIRDLCLAHVGDTGRVERQVLLELEMACLIYMKKTVQQVSAEEAKTLEWNFRLFHEYMQHCLELGKAGQMTYQEDTPDVDWLNMDPVAEKELLDRVARTSTGGAVLIQHGEHLPEILRGELPPLQILMQDNFLHDFYQNGIGTEQHYAQMCWYVDALAHKNPNMSVLEIGGGTAGATLPVLQALGGGPEGYSAPRFEKYVFTDISVGYFEKARQKLAPWVPFMDFARLNIEEDPSDQGFEEGKYDLIVASNVLHATKSIHNTLVHTRKLLKPNGKLVLTEVTPFGKMRFHMVVGSLEGWWYGEEDGRHYGPTLTIDEWSAALQKAGFQGVDVDFQDYIDPKDCGLSVIVSSNVDPAAIEPPAPEDVLIVLSENPDEDLTSGAQKVAAGLQAQGSQVAIVSLQDTANLDVENKSILCLVDAGKGRGFLPSLAEVDWQNLKRIVLKSREITYVTRGGTGASENPFSNLMTGMARSIRSENYGLSFTTLDAEYSVPLDDEAVIASILKIFNTACYSKELERPDWEYAIRDGKPSIQRVLLEKGVNEMAFGWNVPSKPEPAPFKQEGRPLTLRVGTPGQLDTLRFEDDSTVAEPLKGDEVEITVKAAGLNFKDVMVAMGQLSQPALGVDCSGVISRVGSDVKNLEVGMPIMTWKLGTFSNLTHAPATMVQPVPEGMDFATAASLPVIYSTAHYSLSHIAHLQPGETLLIHGAAGGVGQAAIMLARHIGATVFATVSSDAKKSLLVEEYGLKPEHVFSSRDGASFAKGIMRLTAGRGVDVVLNSLAGEALRAGWRAIARFGRFIELGQKDIVGNTGLDMAPFMRNVSFHSVNMLDLLDHDCPRASRVFAEVAELVRNGVARPVKPITVLPFSAVEEAFRLMQTGKHTGKIVLEAKDDDTIAALPARMPPVRLSTDATYIIAGGGGGLGRHIASWMVTAGARHILLLSRSGDKKPATRGLIRRLAKDGAQVAAWPCDVASEAELGAVLERHAAEGWPPIRGVVQGAMALHDAIFDNMTIDQFLGATAPKVQGSWNLHAMLPREMDFYVLLSSSVGIAGSRGQGNYSAGNSFQDALAHYRRDHCGLPACSIDVGMIMGVGFLAEETTETRVHDNVKAWSFLGIREAEFLGIMEAAIRGESVKGAKVPPQLITGLGTGGILLQSMEKYPWWFHDAKFAHIVRVDTRQVSQQEGSEGPSLTQMLAQVSSIEQAEQLVVEAFVNKLARSLMVSSDNIEASKPVSSYGVDSLLAVEVRTWIHTDIRADISVFDLLSNTPITGLAKMIVASSKAVPESVLTAEQ